MSYITELISKLNGMKCLGGCSEQQLNEAQIRLGLKFPKEYEEYLLNFGTIRFNGVELCGLNSKGYLNVVEATEQEKEINSDFPTGMYIIEDLGIDSKLIIGDEAGMVYLHQRGKSKKICNSFLEYIEKCQYR